MKVLVVDDEPLARRRLMTLLRRLVIVTQVEEAGEAETAIQRGPTHDVVLLDIEMPGPDGLHVAQQLKGRTVVVFVTAHPQHALAAFDTAAVDYLLKPVRSARLEQALARVAQRSSTPSHKLAARAHDGIHYFDPEDIECFWATDKVVVFNARGREHITEQSLASLDATLPGFVRVHRGFVVQQAAIVRLARGDEGPYVELRSGRRVPVSRRLMPELQARLTQNP